MLERLRKTIVRKFSWKKVKKELCGRKMKLNIYIFYFFSKVEGGISPVLHRLRRSAGVFHSTEYSVIEFRRPNYPSVYSKMVNHKNSYQLNVAGAMKTCMFIAGRKVRFLDDFIIMKQNRGVPKKTKLQKSGFKT